MALETFEFDAAGSNVDGTNPGSALVLMSAASNYYVTAFNSPAPAPKMLWASSIDTDGARRADPSSYENRTVTLTIEPKDSSSTSTHLDALTGKVAKLHREGGTLKWTRRDGSVRIFDLLASDGYGVTVDVRYEQGRPEVALSFMALPGMRGAEQDLGDNVETTLPCLVFTEASIPGDFAALGRLVIDNDVAADQWWLTWGLESRYYSSSANAALFYEAEGRTALGGSATAAGPTGASGAGSNVVRNTALSTNYVAAVSTQATGGGAHLSHIGTFRVLARVQVPTTNTGTVSVALEWAEGDFRQFTQNPAASISSAWEGTWQILDLGLVSLTKVTAGTQRWEGRIVAKSTVSGDDIDVDWLTMVPATEGSGEVRAVSRIASVTSFTARDEFDQTAGALVGKTAPTGGTWSGVGDADDFALNTTDKTARRTAISDTAARFERLGSGTLTDVVVQADIKKTSSVFQSAACGAFARYTDANNVFYAFLNFHSGSDWLYVNVVSLVAGAVVYQTPVSSPQLRYSPGTSYTVRLSADSAGRYSAWAGTTGSALILQESGARSELATGGTLATGGYGMYDYNPFGLADTRDFDNFAVWAPAADAAMFASQSLEIRHDGVRREDSGGTLWVTPSSYVGDYLRVPASGAEARTTRMIIKASRNVPGQGPDSATDDISARLFITPRYL